MMNERSESIFLTFKNYIQLYILKEKMKKVIETVLKVIGIIILIALILRIFGVF